MSVLDGACASAARPLVPPRSTTARTPTHHLVMIIELETELPLLRLSPPQLRITPKGDLGQLLLLVLD